VASETVTATIMNGINGVRDAMNFILSPPRAYAYRTADKSTTDAVDTLYDMDTELYDPYSTAAHDNATNNSRLVAAETGIYVCYAQMTWAANATGRRRLTIRKNSAGSSTGGTQVGRMDVPVVPAGTHSNVVAALAQLTAGDYVEMFGQQTSGGALNILTGVGNSYLAFEWSTKQ
jgi:hypothetical protein